MAVKQPLGEEGGLKKQPQFALVPNDEFPSQRKSGNSEEDWRTKMQSDSQCSGLRGVSIIDIDLVKFGKVCYRNKLKRLCVLHCKRNRSYLFQTVVSNHCGCTPRGVRGVKRPENL